MRKGIFTSCIATALLLATAIPGLAAGPAPCADARDAVLNARNALKSYFSAKGEYPGKLSATTFSSPDNVVVIYEKMDIGPAEKFYMVRSYAENCGTMYLAAPTDSEVIQIPLVPGDTKQAAAKAARGDADSPSGSSGSMPIIVSIATFFTVFILIILLFYIRNKKTVPPLEPEKDNPSPPTGDE